MHYDFRSLDLKANNTYHWFLRGFLLLTEMLHSGVPISQFLSRPQQLKALGLRWDLVFYSPAPKDRFAIALVPFIVGLGVQLGGRLPGKPTHTLCCSSCSTCSLVSHEDEMVLVHPDGAGVQVPGAARAAVLLLLTLHTFLRSHIPEKPVMVIYTPSLFPYTPDTLEILLRESDFLNQGPRWMAWPFCPFCSWLLAPCGGREWIKSSLFLSQQAAASFSSIFLLLETHGLIPCISILLTAELDQIHLKCDFLSYYICYSSVNILLIPGRAITLKITLYFNKVVLTF